MLSKELVAASTKPLILSLLQGGDNYGYALLQEIERISASEIVWSEGMLYPVLHRMEADGIIESYWQEVQSGRARKYYRLTKTGRPALKAEKEQWMMVNQVLTKLWNPTQSST